MLQQVFLVLCISSCLVFSNALTAQDFSEPDTNQFSENSSDDEYKLKDHIITGGNLGAQFGDVTFINIAPMIGYKFNKRFTLGFRGTYQYFRLKGVSNISSHVLGAGSYARFFFTDALFAHTEYEVLNGHFDGSGQRGNIPFLFIGGGYLYPISDNVGLSVTALYEVLRSQYSPYAFPIIRGGVVIGF